MNISKLTKAIVTSVAGLSLTACLPSGGEDGTDPNTLTDASVYFEQLASFVDFSDYEGGTNIRDAKNARAINKYIVDKMSSDFIETYETSGYSGSGSSVAFTTFIDQGYTFTLEEGSIDYVNTTLSGAYGLVDKEGFSQDDADTVLTTSTGVVLDYKASITIPDDTSIAPDICFTELFLGDDSAFRSGDVAIVESTEYSYVYSYDEDIYALGDNPAYLTTSYLAEQGVDFIVPHLKAEGFLSDYKPSRDSAMFDALEENDALMIISGKYSDNRSVTSDELKEMLFVTEMNLAVSETGSGGWSVSANRAAMDNPEALARQIAVPTLRLCPNTRSNPITNRYYTVVLALSILKERFPQLTNKALANILLDTSIKGLSQYEYTSEVGLMDLKSALLVDPNDYL